MSDLIKNWDYYLPIILIVGVPFIMVLFGGYLSCTELLRSKKNKVPLKFKKFFAGLALAFLGTILLLLPVRV